MEKENLLSKIEKMLRLADKKRGGSIHEADTAMGLVHKLLKKNGLSMADVMTEEEAQAADSSLDIKEVEGATFKCSKVPKWMTILVSVVNSITDTKTLIRSFIPKGKTYGTIKIIFIGYSEDVAIANELFHYLRKSITKLSTKHQNSSEGKHRQWRSFAEGCSCKLMERTLELNRKWTPEGTNAPCDIDNFECDDDEDFDELDIDNWIEDDDDDSGDFGFGEETHKKYEIIIANKKEKIDEYIDQMEVEVESLSTSANMDHSSFHSGTIAAEGISLKVHKLVGKG